MKLGDLQAHLEEIYGVRCDERAEHFLVDEARARLLGATGNSSEELLVVEHEDELEIGLYFSPSLLGALEAHATPAQLAADDLEAYCELLEGVSHFVYLVGSAHRERRVSLLELEAQAEIDKFASVVLQGWRQGARFAAEVVERLFDRVTFRATLSPEQRWRYREANRLSRNYCLRLLRHVATQRVDRLLSDLRYSYRLGAAAKLQHLALQPA